jgi:hypothetical protein
MQTHTKITKVFLETPSKVEEKVFLSLTKYCAKMMCGGVDV